MTDTTTTRHSQLEWKHDGGNANYTLTARGSDRVRYSILRSNRYEASGRLLVHVPGELRPVTSLEGPVEMLKTIAEEAVNQYRGNGRFDL